MTVRPAFLYGCQYNTKTIMHKVHNFRYFTIKTSMIHATKCDKKSQTSSWETTNIPHSTETAALLGNRQGLEILARHVLGK